MLCVREDMTDSQQICLNVCRPIFIVRTIVIENGVEIERVNIWEAGNGCEGVIRL